MSETPAYAADGSSVSIASPWLFFLVTFAITWSCWLAVLALGIPFESPAGLVLLLAGLTGPAITGIGFVYLVYDDPGRRDFWARLIGVRRIGDRWVLVVLVLPPAVVLSGAAVDLLLGGSGATWGEWVPAFAGDPLVILPAVFFATLPPLLEELGWRGYALDRLQLHWSALNAGVILGVVWSVWHLPLFFIEGTYQHDTVGFGTVEFWLFVIGIVPLSVTFTWVYNHTARSILVIILFHGMVNFTGEAIEITRRAEGVFVCLWIAFAILLVVIWGPKTLTGDDTVPGPPLSEGR